MESELFGHVTGGRIKAGMFQQADGGTVFLDEIEKMEISSQKRLLKFLIEGEVNRVGDNKLIHFDVRIITATNENLEVLLEQQVFLKDLYLQLAVVTLEISPVRERQEDTRLPTNPTEGIVTQSPVMVEILGRAEKVAETDATVLLRGETGTGKKSVAQYIYSKSRRRNLPLTSVNCAGVRKELLESELFGHVKGAFTGAVNNKVGIFEQANGGTVFLEEVEKMEIECQSKLLRFLTEGEFKRIGDNEPFRSDVRIIVATDTNLDMIAEPAKFLKPLYFRLAVVQLELPPLRERPEDIPLLAEHFLRRCSQKHQKTIAGFEKDVLDILLTYKWPGNVKELENAIERAVIFSPGRYLSSKDFNEYKDEDGSPTDCNLETQFRLAEFKCITKALMMSNGEITRATRLVRLKDNRKKFYELLKKHQIDISKYKKYF